MAENSPGLGAPETEEQGFAGNCAPSPDRRSVENPSGLGAKGTEVQGFAGYRAPSPGRRLAENSPGLGAPGTEAQVFAGNRAPSPDRRSVENPSGLGATGTEVQGFAGNRAPSPDRRLAENSPGLGAPGTEVQGLAGYCAPSPSRRLAENSPGLGAKGTEAQGLAGYCAPSPGRRFKSKPDDNKCVLKGNFFCGTVGAQRGGGANATRADCRRRRRTEGGAEREDEAMRLKLVMKDREYRDALAERIRRSRWNLYVIIEDNFRMEEDTLLVTDVGEGKLREGMVLLSSECRREVEGKGPYVLFKYAGVDELLTDLRLCAFLWTGKGDLRRGEERIVTVGAVERTDLGHRLAEQVALELGERLEEPVLLLDLTYFYREGQPEESGNTFRKLVYYLQSGKSIPVEVFFRRERGNVFRVRMPRGMNELMKIPGRECLELIREMGRYFSAVVCSVGDCFSERNIEVMKNSEWCIYMAEEDMREYFPKTSLVVPERTGEIRNAARLVQGILETP